jgi:GPH family glycoside/pentoside/hexuronide:cation symporter
MNFSDSNPVPLDKKFAYAAPAFALAVVGIPVYVYIPKFYTDVVVFTSRFWGISSSPYASLMP